MNCKKIFVLKLRKVFDKKFLKQSYNINKKQRQNPPKNWSLWEIEGPEKFMLKDDPYRQVMKTQRCLRFFFNCWLRAWVILFFKIKIPIFVLDEIR